MLLNDPKVRNNVALQIISSDSGLLLSTLCTRGSAPACCCSLQILAARMNLSRGTWVAEQMQSAAGIQLCLHRFMYCVVSSHWLVLCTLGGGKGCSRERRSRTAVIAAHDTCPQKSSTPTILHLIWSDGRSVWVRFVWRSRFESWVFSLASNSKDGRIKLGSKAWLRTPGFQPWLALCHAKKITRWLMLLCLQNRYLVKCFERY